MARYHHGDLRRALVQAAVEIIEAEGPHSLTLRKAARVAGVSHAAPAHHFGDLRGLIAAVAKRGWEGLLRAMQAPTESERGLDRLRQVGQGYVMFAMGNVGLFRAMFHPELARNPSPSDEHRASVDATYRYVTSVVALCQAEGAVRPGDPDELANLAWSTVHGAAALLVDGALGPSAEAVAMALTRDLYLGLRPP